MCLYTRYIPNPKFKKNKKNGGNPPICTDRRIAEIPIECGDCIECRRKKARQWAIRLKKEIQYDRTGQFVTLTFSDEKMKYHEEYTGTKEANEVATAAIKLFRERWRKKYGKSIKHWFITELGHKGTERMHIHGIIFTDKTKEEIEERWQNGRIDVGYEMNEKCINYIMKYITKIDKDHKGFKGKINPSPGIGKDYLNKWETYRNRYQEGGKTEENIKTENGTKIAMPTYMRNKIYTEEEREQEEQQKKETKKTKKKGQ